MRELFRQVRDGSEDLNLFHHLYAVAWISRARQAETGERKHLIGLIEQSFFDLYGDVLYIFQRGFRSTPSHFALLKTSSRL